MEKDPELTIHVFVGTFADRDTAYLYTQEQWQPEPDEGVSDEEYSAWEDANPSWAFRSDLGIYLDSDFVEERFGDDRFDHLWAEIADLAAIESLREQYAATTNTLVMVGSCALGGFPAELKSTPRLLYCGEYASTPVYSYKEVQSP